MCCYILVAYYSLFEIHIMKNPFSFCSQYSMRATSSSHRLWQSLDSSAVLHNLCIVYQIPLSPRVEREFPVYIFRFEAQFILSFLVCLLLIYYFLPSPSLTHFPSHCFISFPCCSPLIPSSSHFSARLLSPLSSLTCFCLVFHLFSPFSSITPPPPLPLPTDPRPCTMRSASWYVRHWVCCLPCWCPSSACSSACAAAATTAAARCTSARGRMPTASVACWELCSSPPRWSSRECDTRAHARTRTRRTNRRAFIDMSGMHKHKQACLSRCIHRHTRMHAHLHTHTHSWDYLKFTALSLLLLHICTHAHFITLLHAHTQTHILP